MSGTINLALSQQFDMDGEPLGGGLLYFFAAGTTDPQSAFQDQLLTILHPNPIVLDASGRVPMFYLADGNVKIRLTDDSGVVVIAADNLLVIGPSSGGGGGGGVDPTTVLQSGDILVRFGTGTHDGFVPCNGRTIGNSISSATERANADCQALFEYLWSTAVLGVFAGATPSRGVSANGDWIANKQIALPDLRGRTLAGMDNMGATAALRLTSAGLGAAATTLGNAGGVETIALAAGNLPVHSHSLAAASGSTGSAVSDGAHAHTAGTLAASIVNSSNLVSMGVAGGTTGNDFQAGTGHIGFTTGNFDNLKIGTFSGSTQTTGAHTHTLTGLTSTGAGTFLATPVKTVMPAMVLTFYMKL